MRSRLLRLLLIGVLGALLSLAVPQAAHGGSVAVTMSHYAFSPASITVNVGDTITWTNTDQAPHDVTTTSAPVTLKSPTLQKGAGWSHTFMVAGTYHYICSIHPDMQATVTVTAPHAVIPVATTPAPRPTTTSAATGVAPPAGVTGAATRTTSAPKPRPDATAPSPASSAAPAGMQPIATAAAAQPSATLRPLLLVAGLVTAGAVFCLLLLATRPRES